MLQGVVMASTAMKAERNIVGLGFDSRYLQYIIIGVSLIVTVRASALAGLLLRQ